MSSSAMADDPTFKEPSLPKQPPKSFADVLAQGLVKTYGQAVKEFFPPLQFSEDPVDAETTKDDQGFHVSIKSEEEWKLAKSLRWVARGIFRGRRKGIAKIDETLRQNGGFRGLFQVSPFTSSEVLIRFQEPRDFIQLLSRTSIKVEGAPMRILRWTPMPKNLNLTYSWCSIRGIPPHLCSSSALQAIFKSWATILAVDQDAKFLTRPEIVRVFMEIDATSPPPDSFLLHGLGGTTKISVELSRQPVICNFCKKLGHNSEVCRLYLKRSGHRFNRKDGDQNNKKVEYAKNSKAADCQMESENKKPPEGSELLSGNPGNKMDEPPSPAASNPSVSTHKNPFGPFLWSSLAGDLHLNYEMCRDPKVQNIKADAPLDRSPKIVTKNFNQPVSRWQPKRMDPKYKCCNCSTAKVQRKGALCRLCSFQCSKKQGRKQPPLSPPKYKAKTAECFFIKSTDDEWEIDAKKELLDIAATELEPFKKAANKEKEIPSSKDSPPKRWGDIASEDENSMDEQQTFQDAMEEIPKGRGKKINSRIGNPTEKEPRKTRSGKGMENKDDGKKEQWIEGIRVLKVRHHDQRHNTTWYQWEVAPDVTISRMQKKRIEHIAQKSEKDG